MVSTILGLARNDAQVWDENDNVVPVTVIQSWPLHRLAGQDEGDRRLRRRQIGFGDISAKHVNKPAGWSLRQGGVEPMRFLREVRVENGEGHRRRRRDRR